MKHVHKGNRDEAFRYPEIHKHGTSCHIFINRVRNLDGLPGVQSYPILPLCRLNHIPGCHTPLHLFILLLPPVASSTNVLKPKDINQNLQLVETS